MNRLLFLVFCSMSAMANADLWVSTVQPAAPTLPPAPDGSVRVDFIIRNIGNQTAFNFFIEGFSNRQQSCTTGLRSEGAAFIQNLPAGQQLSGSFIIYAQPGDLNLYAVVKADTTNVVIENSESNNCLTSFNIAVRNPDLVVLSTSAPEPLRIVPGGDSASFLSVIRNNSSPSGWAAGESHVRYFVSTALSNPPLSSRLQLSSYTPKLPDGSFVDIPADIGVPSNFPLGTYNLFAKADGDDEVFERNDNNNFSSSSTLEVVDMCTLADVNQSGSVNILDLILLVNGAVSLVTPANQHLDLRRSPVPFPPLINREDLLAALPCFGSFNFDGSLTGTLNDFSVVATGSGSYRLDLNMSGSVTALSCYLVKPQGASIVATSLQDRLASGYMIQLNPDNASMILANEFHTTTMATRELVNGSLASFSADFDMSKLRTVSNGDDFDAGLAVQVTFGDGSRSVIMKRFDYLNLPDPALRAYVEQLYGVAPGDWIPASLTSSTKSLNLSWQGIADLSGIQNFRGLTTVDASYNDLTETPDLSRMATLQNFWAQGNQISQLGPLPPNLKTLLVSDNELDEVKAISGLSQLLFLSVDRNQLKSLPSLAGMSQLEHVHCGDNELAALPALPSSLNILLAYNNHISKLPNLSGLNFEILDLHGNFIFDIASLANPTWTTNALCDLANNNLDASDCAVLEVLKHRVADFTYEPQRSVASPCIFSNDL